MSELQARVEEGIGDEALGRRRLRFVRTVALSYGIQGPVAGVLVGPASMALLLGNNAGALAYLLGLVAMAFVAYAFVVFSRSFNSAGSVYAFNGSAVSPSYGFVSAWILLLVYVSFAGGVYASTADIAQTFFASFGLHAWWGWFALAGFAVTMVFAYLSISLSSVAIFVCEGAATVLLAVVGAAVLAGGGHHGHAWSAAPFLPHGLAFGVLGLGVVNAFGGFSGFEGAATLGEEAEASTRTIPRAVAASLLVAAAVYIVFTWIADNAYPDARSLAGAAAPFVHLADAYVGPTMAKAVSVGGIVSAFGAQLACINAANRLLFALGRDVAPAGGGLRRLLTRTDVRTGSPVGALAVTGTVSLCALLGFSGSATAVTALTDIITYGAYLIIIAYLLTVVAALAFVWQRSRNPLSLAVLSVGAAVLGYVLWDTFVPFPKPPYDRIVWSAAASAVLGAVIAAAPGIRARLAASPLLRATRRPTLAEP